MPKFQKKPDSAFRLGFDHSAFPFKSPMKDVAYPTKGEVTKPTWKDAIREYFDPVKQFVEKSDTIKKIKSKLKK